MPGDTNIEWSDKSWNPTTGCTQVSPGCAHCYAKTMTERFHGKGSFDTVHLHPDRLDAPLHWRKPSRVFVNSMSDLFHEDIGAGFVDKIFKVMWKTPQHTYQVLTKRPERMRDYLTATPMLAWERDAEPDDEEFRDAVWGNKGPLPNVWLGVTVENQRFADSRIEQLLRTPAAVHFVSAEPLLESISFTRIDAMQGPYNDWLRGEVREVNAGEEGIFARFKGLDWVIVGGESGPKHRPFDPEWARSIVAQCRDAGVACFVKQLGGARPGNKLEDLPPDLQVREYPTQVTA